MQGWVRIIGGKWRSRRLKVLQQEGLRPTPDRVRETLFNWLADWLPGARCLDLFAGSGVLGFEALSRGALQAVFVEQSPQGVALLKEEADVLKADNAKIYCATLPRHLPTLSQVFDIVFIDPPYHTDLLLPMCHLLEKENYLANPSRIYLEAERPIEDNELPAHWHIIKNQRAGDVFYHLVHREFTA